MTQFDKSPPILDIELPALPQNDNELLLWILIVFGMSAIAVTRLWLYYRTKRYKALLAIKKLMQAVNAQSIDSCTCAYEISRLLRSTLNLSRICARTVLPGALSQQQKRWQAFIGIMDQARYSPIPCSPSTINHMLHEAKFWLEQWPAASSQ